MDSKEVDSSNFKKYNTGNPVVRFLFKCFFDKVREVIEKHNFKSALEAGCGEGFAIRLLDDVLPDKLTAFDISKDSVDYAREHCSRGEFMELNICQLPFLDNSFEFTMCCEVLEHLSNPEQAMNELLRVTSSTLLLSVPDEPYFSIGSLCRGKYLKTFGRHPEHLQAWNIRSFRSFLDKYDFAGLEIYRSFPWLIAVIDIGEVKS